MARTYYVVGGEYADTTFTTLAPGQSEETFGPFEERQAHECWRALTGKTVDNAMVRYFIRETGPETGEGGWYVVGGEYTGTDFTTIAAGSPAQVLGPFDRQTALATWRDLTGRTVDSALTRFDLSTEAELKRRGLLVG
ncbi:DUF4170 domain-containing protein [Magnetospirillum fulvum]|uniref:DUF4170 domain-containing protein n=1 Tax=Magnetospirillum fulvum MGU-K5 TaxID=1316936 RepID=S9S9Z1_MAGFU|nr:DUF4170 domain-containing protein [Magnetospirillum fulvum]EPY02687.1 hypothetical protein K678_04422 [Magnetospirillum fulvum MGU-K5]